MGREAAAARQGAEIEAFAATGVEHDIAGLRRNKVSEACEQGIRIAAIVQPAPCGDGFHGIARPAGTPLLGLQEIEVATARDVEGMSARAKARRPARVNGRWQSLTEQSSSAVQ